MRNTIQIPTKEKKLQLSIYHISHISTTLITFFDLIQGLAWLGMAWLTCIKFSPLRVPVKY